ncbi:MAG TPA: HAD-IIB family hydrolase [Terriglobia bacterium]|nr:HAD-IIB family hydrolase [Terriglobia bacterium]
MKSQATRAWGGEAIGAVFTDLDGTLLDRETYRWTAARPALDILRRRCIPLVIVTSKAAAEVWPLVRALARREPLVVENGGAIIFPTRYFPFTIAGARPLRRGWHEVILGAPRRRLITALARAARRAQVCVRGFNDMSAREVAELTSLSLEESRRALERQCDEPFLVLDRKPAAAWRRLRREIRRLGFTATRGTRLFHITASDKGAGVRRVVQWFRRAGVVSATVGLGDSPNDIPLLRTVDLAIVVAGAGGRYDAETLAAVPKARRAGGAGPVGWNRSILELLSG